MRKNTQSGFTLIELIVVMIILGILAAVALPKFIDLSSEAKKASLQGVAGAIASGSAINYAAKLAGKAGTVSVADCTNLAALVTTDVAFVGSGTSTAAAGEQLTCTLGYGTTTAISTSVTLIASP